MLRASLLRCCVEMTALSRVSSLELMKRLLIVDDSKLMRDMVAACLRPLGAVAFDFASSGLEAIERLALAPFDLMVLDLNMPDVGGVEVVEFVRAQDRLRELPILIVTTRGDDESRAQVLAAGASSFLTKPFPRGTFSTRCVVCWRWSARSAVRRREQRRRSARLHRRVHRRV